MTNVVPQSNEPTNSPRFKLAAVVMVRRHRRREEGAKKGATAADKKEGLDIALSAWAVAALYLPNIDMLGSAFTVPARPSRLALSSAYRGPLWNFNPAAMKLADNHSSDSKKADILRKKIDGYFLEKK